MQPRLIRLRDAANYLGMDRNRFNKEVRPFLITLKIGQQEIATQVALSRFGLNTEAEEPLPSIQHVFTHFKLEITPQPLHVVSKPLQANMPNLIWLPIEDAIGAALPTPVRNILLNLG